MQRLILFLLPFLFALALLPSGDASAKAIYAWVPDDREACCRGILELSDDAYFAGQAAWTQGTPAPFPVERFFFEGRFTVLDELKRNPENPTLVITVTGNLASQPDAERCCEWDIQVRVTETGGLEGRARLKTKTDEIVMSGTGDQWTLDLARSDILPSGIVCGAAPKTTCSSATGRWVLVSEPTAKK